MKEFGSQKPLNSPILLCNLFCDHELLGGEKPGGSQLVDVHAARQVVRVKHGRVSPRFELPFDKSANNPAEHIVHGKNRVRVGRK